MSVCFYCKSPNVSVCLCLACRTRLEVAAADLERLKKDREVRVAAFFKAQKQKKRRR